MFQTAIYVGTGLVGLIFVIGIPAFLRAYRKVDQGTALVRNGLGGSTVSFSGILVFPIVHRLEQIDISVKRIEIFRHGSEGLICQDNLRADIKVAFFVRVNKTQQDVMQVAQMLGCERASDEKELVGFFDAKFSEALKTVGKQFDFVDLYNSREKFKEEILKTIGTDLNGYVLDDAAIDYLEQTPLEHLNPDNILDVEGIKKITDLTAQQQVLANGIRREKEKTLKKQDVEAREAILMLERQQSEAEEKQHREIAEIQSRERAEAAKVSHEQRLKSEQARIQADEEIGIAEENRQRQIIVAQKNKQRTEFVETERVEKDRALEATERDRIVSLAQIEKEKALEVERKAIQDVIRERIVVERAVVEEEQKIKDTSEFATAERERRVAIINAEREAEEALVKHVKEAEAAKQASTFLAEQQVIEAEASRASAVKESEAKKMLSEGRVAEVAADGIASAKVLEAKAQALKIEGEAKAESIRMQGQAEAEVTRAKASAFAEEGEAQATSLQARGAAEAKSVQLKLEAEATGISKKAEAMKLLDGVGREHEEFKIKIGLERDVRLAEINIRQGIAEAQAKVVAEALKSARIDIVGGEATFFRNIVDSISQGKSTDRLFENSRSLSAVKNTFFGGDGNQFRDQLAQFVNRFGLSSEAVKNLSIAGLVHKLAKQTDDVDVHRELKVILDSIKEAGMERTKVATLNLDSVTTES